MKKLLSFAAFVGIATLMIFREDAMQSAQNGFILWRDYVLPALLPYFIFVSILVSSGTLSNNPVILLLLSILSGAPGGAKSCSFIKKEQDLYLKTDLAAILNTVSPMFVYSSFCAKMLNCAPLAIPILTAQIVTVISSLLMYLKKKKPNVSIEQETQNHSLLPVAITTSINALLGICGAMIFFSVVICILKASGFLAIIAFPFEWLAGIIGIDERAVEPLLCGMLEVTTGSTELAKSGLGIRETAFCAGFMFSFGGLCIMAQSATFFKLSIKRYIALKAVIACFSGMLSYFGSIFIIEPHIAALAQNDQSAFMQNATSFIIIFTASALCEASILLISIGCKKMRCTKRTPQKQTV